jgi:hypothetical protein
MCSECKVCGQISGPGVVLVYHYRDGRRYVVCASHGDSELAAIGEDT